MLKTLAWDCPPQTQTCPLSLAIGASLRGRSAWTGYPHPHVEIADCSATWSRSLPSVSSKCTLSLVLVMLPAELLLPRTISHKNLACPSSSRQGFGPSARLTVSYFPPTYPIVVTEV